MKRRRAVIIVLTISLLVVLLIITGGGLWLRVQQEQYARNRQLIEALQQGHASQAIALVQAGADPNTRLEPSPLPSIKEMLLRMGPVPTSPISMDKRRSHSPRRRDVPILSWCCNPVANSNAGVSD